MNAHYDKIKTYLAEIAAHWGDDSARSNLISLAFFELWERLTEPRPARVVAKDLKRLGVPLPPGKADPMVAFLEWDFARHRPVLVVESPSGRVRHALSFNDGGEAVFCEGETEMEGDRSVPHGELVESVRCVLTQVRERQPGWDVRKLKRKDFATALDWVDPPLKSRVRAVLGRLKLANIRSLIDEAVADMAGDELSDQLVLPLDGSYAAAVASRSDGAQHNARPPMMESNASPPPTGSGAPSGATHANAIAPRTVGRVLADVDLLCAIAEKVAEAERASCIPLNGAQVVSDCDDGLTVRVTLDDPSDICGFHEGQTVRLVAENSTGAVGSFAIDIFDGSEIYGRVRLDDSFAPSLDQLVAVPPPSSSRFILQFLRGLLQFVGEDDKKLSASARAALGLDPVCLGTGTGTGTETGTPLQREPQDLDDSQRAAWRLAVGRENPIVIVQGPPGTGKTHVLEAILRTLVGRGESVLLAAPSHAAVDNLCRRLLDLPLLRLARNPASIAQDVCAGHWAGDLKALERFTESARGRGYILAGTMVAVLKDQRTCSRVEAKGPFDAVVFDEAGMSRTGDLLLCANYAARVVAFGDHLQLPPFPLPRQATKALESELGPFCRDEEMLIRRSALEWLHCARGFPVVTLGHSYRCHNPRLLRFASSLFYDARVVPSSQVEYFRLPYEERANRYPPSTLLFLRTSNLPAELRSERLVIEGGQPGIENELEADVCVGVCADLASRHPLEEITVMSPYRRQLRLIRAKLKEAIVTPRFSALGIDPDLWMAFIHSRIVTVDSFQGGESDAVVISYTRSGGSGIGFVDDPNRVNVAHTRPRRELVVVGDLEHLKSHSGNSIFAHMERAFARDGMIVDVDGDGDGDGDVNGKVDSAPLHAHRAME